MTHLRHLLLDAVRRLPSDLRRGRAAVWRRPPVVTISLVVCIAVTFVRLQIGAHLPALTYVSEAYSPRALTQGHLRLIATSTLLTRDPFMLISISVSLLVALGTYEVLAGPVRALVMAVVGATLGPALVTAALGVLVLFGSSWAEGRLGTLDIGASAIIAAASGGVAGLVRQRLFTLGLVLFLIGGLLVHHRIADWEHLFIFPTGYAVGRLFGRSRRPAPRRPGRRFGLYAVAAALLLAVGLTACSRLLPSAPVRHSASGAVLSPARVVDTSYPSPVLGHRSRRVLMLLPAGYDSTQNRFPVVVLLHGHPGRPDDLFSLGNLQNIVNASGIAPFIAVMPDGNGPRHDDSWFANIPSQQMGTAASVDLRSWVTKTYRTTGSWSYAGLSSGGFGAAYLPLVDRRPIHAECGLSGYYDASRVPFPPGTSGAARRRDDPLAHLDRAPPTVFLAYGRSDAKTERQTLRYAAALRRARHRVVVKVYPGHHQWSVWQPAFRDCFRLIVPAHAHR